MQTYFINRPNLDRFCKSLAKAYRVYAPVKSGEDRYYKKLGDEGLQDAVIGGIRAVQSIKNFYFPVRQKIAEYFSKDISIEKKRPIVIIGVKSCDIASLKIMDYVFKQDIFFRDPFYISQRQDTLIISADCTSYKETCFCTALGITPYPVEDFDMNLSEIESGYVVDIGSEKGEKVLKEYSKLFQNPEVYVDKRKENRRYLKEQLGRHLKDKRIPARDAIQGLFKKRFDSELWKETVKTCVECGACNVVCPACHCFVLKDQKKEGGFERLRLWDSCLLLSFAGVAGGANPRRLLAERLRNRFDKKFNFFPNAIGKFGCTGCGRCTDACPGKIDICEVLTKLNDR